MIRFISNSDDSYHAQHKSHDRHKEWHFCHHTLSAKDNNDMKVMVVFKHIDQKPFSNNKNNIDLK